MIDIIFDMETDDSDDFITLLMLLGHPKVNLKAVTVFPGSPQQIGFIRRTINMWFDQDIPIGAHNLKTPKPRLSDWHYQAYGSAESSEDAQSAGPLLLDMCDENTTLLMGAPLTNFRTASRFSDEQKQDLKIGKIVVQGGFAGDGIVPNELQLEKFKGHVAAPSHNLLGDSKATKKILNYHPIHGKYFVSKNVCHRVIYDRDLHNLVGDKRSQSQALGLIWQGMDKYFHINPNGKMFHDPLAACCAINPDIAEWREVSLFKEGNAWGARLDDNTDTFIIIDYNHPKFLDVFLAI
jgi:inosine-uridine nucleoside N-ribohydrolase